MGIPGLTAKLQPYATSSTLGCGAPECIHHKNDGHDETRVIIDGPSLAYHIYYRLLACKAPSLNALDAAPSYEELGRGTLVFLDALREHNVVMYEVKNDMQENFPTKSFAVTKSTSMVSSRRKSKPFDYPV